MRREILFRGKRKYDGKWLYGVPVKTTSNAYYECIEIVEQIEYETDLESYTYVDGEGVEPETIGQFTGLYDRNGTKIFEDDIVMFIGSNDVRSVVFDESSAGFEFDSKDSVENPDGLCLCADHDACEVIGNIYDNPELLEVDDEIN